MTLFLLARICTQYDKVELPTFFLVKGRRILRPSPEKYTASVSEMTISGSCDGQHPHSG